MQILGANMTFPMNKVSKSVIENMTNRGNSYFPKGGPSQLYTNKCNETYEISSSSNTELLLSASCRAIAPSKPNPFHDRLIFFIYTLF